MTDFDPTTNRTPLVLLTAEERAILKAWPHGWQVFYGDRWLDSPRPEWSMHMMIYCGKPAPAVETYFCNVYDQHCVFGWHDSYENAVRLADTESIGIICVEIVDGKLKAVRLVEEEET